MWHTAEATRADIQAFRNERTEPLMSAAARLNFLAPDGVARTLWDGEERLACGGILAASPGVGVAWLFCRAPFPQDRSRLLYRLRREWRAMVEMTRFRRIEALVLADFEIGRWLVRWLGFGYSVDKPLYGPCGETMVEFVLYPETRAEA